MIIYVTHASSFDYHKELYKPLKQVEKLLGHTFILPHEESKEPYDSKKLLEEVDLVLAEVTYPSTGQGIELGWASFYQRRIVCFYKEGFKYSSSLKKISSEFNSYKDSSDLVKKLLQFLS